MSGMNKIKKIAISVPIRLGYSLEKHVNPVK